MPVVTPEHDDATVRLHVRVAAPERSKAAQRRFQDALRPDPLLEAAYAAPVRADDSDGNRAKGSLLRRSVVARWPPNRTSSRTGFVLDADHPGADKSEPEQQEIRLV